MSTPGADREAAHGGRGLEAASTLLRVELHQHLDLVAGLLAHAHAHPVAGHLGADHVLQVHGVTHLDVVDFTQAKADDANALCDKHRVRISGLGYYPNILSANAEESQVAIEHLKRVIGALKAALESPQG